MNRSIIGVAVALVGLTAAPAQATFPGANGRLVFERGVGKQVDLFSIDPEGTGLQRLTHTAGFEEKPEWSGDGSAIAFGRTAPSGFPGELWTMGASGSGTAKVTTFGTFTGAPTWSPEGALAYFSTHDFPNPKGDAPPPPAELYALSAARAVEQRLTHDRSIQTDPEWSPDGSTIAYSQWYAVRGQAGVFDLGVSLMDADGGNVRPLFPASAKRDIASHDWSPDGRQLVVEIIDANPNGRDGGRQSDLAVINADGTGLRRLTRTAALEATPVWSPDGTRIAFTSDRHAHGKHLDRGGPAFEIYTMWAAGGDIRRITHNHVPDFHPGWQAIAGDNA